VNVAGFELAQPVINSKALTRAGAVSLPALPLQRRAGFLSLLNGLLDQNVTAIRDVATPRPVKRPGATLPDPAVATKPKEEKSQSPTGPAIGTRLNQLAGQGVIASTSFLPTPIEIPTGDTTVGRLPVAPVREAKETSSPTHSAPLAVRCLDATGSPSATLGSEDSPVQPMHNIAFALRLTWQPTGNVHVLIPNGPPPPVALQGQAGPRNPLSLDTPKHESAPPSEGASNASRPEAAPKAVLKPVAQSAESQNSEPVDPPGHSSLLSLPSLSSASVGTLLVRETTGASSSKISGELRQNNVNAAPSKEGPSTEASDNLGEIAPQLQMSRSALPSFIRASAGLPRPDIAGRDAPIANSEVEAKDPASIASNKQGGEAPTPTPTPERSPSSRIISARQATPPDDSGSVNDRDPVPSESERKAPRGEIAEKSPQIEVSNQPADHAVAGASPAGVAVPGGTIQTQTKVSAAPQQPTTVSQELQTANPAQSQPIREISFRLGADSSQVDVQVAQRAGKIQVAVRTADPELAKSLQTNLGEVVGRLEDKGFRTETWTPMSGHGASALREPNSANSQSSDSSSQNSQQDRRQGQQESNQRQQQRWKAQLEDMFLAPSTPANEGEQI
jgi:hypothetical protein